jgi:hypothetical protein
MMTRPKHLPAGLVAAIVCAVALAAAFAQTASGQGGQAPVPVAGTGGIGGPAARFTPCHLFAHACQEKRR